LHVANNNILKNYITRACHDTPSQYIKIDILENTKNSLFVRSQGIFCESDLEKPNITFIQDRKKNVGPSK